MKIRYMIAAALAFAAAGTALSQMRVPVPKFEAVELNGGGRIVLRHGPVQRVTLLRGSTAVSRFEVDRPKIRTTTDKDARLTIRACEQRCPRDYRLEVEIEMPDIAALAVKGGGTIVVNGGFGRQDNLAAAVHGGGSIDARALAARNAAAAVKGGGALLVRAEQTLAATVQGGGGIRYWGDPSVVRSIQGGGSVQRGR